MFIVAVRFSAANPKIVITDDVIKPLNYETRASTTSGDGVKNPNAVNTTITPAMRRSHSTFSAKVNR